MSDAKVIPLRGAEGIGLEEQPDETLMLASAAGSTAAFEVLVRRFHPRLARYAAKYLGDAAAGDELAQEALVRIWQARRSYAPSARFTAFALTVVRNLCRSQLRRLRPAAEEPPPAGDKEPLERLIEQENARRVREALQRLPNKHREVLLLRFDQELDYPDIASLLGRNEATLRSRVFHALRKLRTLLSEGAR